MGFLNTVFDSMVDRTAEELIGAMLMALSLSLAATGFYTLIRKRKEDRAMYMSGVVLVANLVAMVLAAGYVEQRQKGVGPVGSGGATIFPAMMPAPNTEVEVVIAAGLIGLADTDRNGRISSEEAAQFVGKVDVSGQGGADVGEVVRALRDPAAFNLLPSSLPGEGMQKSETPAIAEGPGS